MAVTNAGNVQEESAEGGGPLMSMNLVTLLYLIASVCFIQALKGLSHPTTSRRGHGQARRDDQDARAGRLHAQHDRPGRGVHRHRRGGRAAVAGDRRAPGRSPGSTC
nr:hypothetical protein [Pseudomonas aeruginosa]